MKYYINAFPAESRAHRFGTACLLNRMPRKKAVRTGFQGLIDQPARLPPAAPRIPRDCLSVPAWVIPEPDPTRRQRPEREMKESGENGRKKAEGREREKLSTPRGPEARPPGAPPGSDKSPRSCPSPWARGSRLPAQMLGFPSFPNPPPPHALVLPSARAPANVGVPSILLRRPRSPSQHRSSLHLLPSPDRQTRS